MRTHAPRRVAIGALIVALVATGLVPHAAAIIGGTTLVDGQHPHLVGIARHGDAEVGCGGSLVAARWVLTAAHCFDGEGASVGNLEVRLGSVNNDVHRSNAQVLSITKIVRHPAYEGSGSPERGADDLALVNLSSDANLASPTIGLIALNPDPTAASAAQPAILAGWGATDATQPQSADVIFARWTKLTIGGDAQLCNAIVDPSSQICAHDPAGSGGCLRDSGGPLIQEDGNGRRILVGVLSAFQRDSGEGCGNGAVNSFERVSSHLEWINETVGDDRATCDGKRVDFHVVPGVALIGTPGADVIMGTEAADFIRGGAGDDVICGGLGIDQIRGDAGNDIIHGDGGSDRIWGGTGHDTIRAGSGADRVHGDAGNDIIFGMGGQDWLWGDSGADTIQGNSESDRIWGGDGNDILRGARGKDKIYGEGGNDELYGGDNTDFLAGGSGIDFADGQRGRDRPLVVGVSGCDAETKQRC